MVRLCSRLGVFFQQLFAACQQQWYAKRLCDVCIGTCLCATEKAFREGRTTWCKPISCYLYPLREKRLGPDLVGLNYHRWNVCRQAVSKGRELGLPLYRFLRDPLIKRFGQAWYDELCEVADALLHQTNEQ